MVAIILAVPFLIGIVYAVYYFTNKNKKDDGKKKSIEQSLANDSISSPVKDNNH